MIELSNSDIISISSAVIAVLALAATIWQAIVARNHSVLSVAPLLEHTHLTVNDQGTTVSIENCGLGPAIIQSIYFRYAGGPEQVRLDQMLNKVASLVKVVGVEIRVTTIVTPTPLLPAKPIELYSLKNFDGNNEELTKLVSLLEHYHLCIDYRCMYGKEFSYMAPLYGN